MRRLEYKWLVGIAFVFGMFMDLLDTTIINVALPNLQGQFHVEVDTIEWVVTGYLLSLAVFIPVAGYLADRFGSKRIYIFALTLFAIGSGLCGLAWNAPSLIAFRVLQGVGGGMLVPVGTATLFRAFPPHERASASAVFAIPTVLAPTLGPILGGALVEYASWRWIFLINLPVAALAIVFCVRFLREHREPNTGSFDIAGFLLSASGFSALLYGLSVAAQRGQGLTSAKPLSFMVAGALLLVALVLVELRVRAPMLDLRLFKERGFAMGNLLNFILSCGLTGGIFLFPLFLQNPVLKGLSPLRSGLTTFPQAIGVGIMMPIAGRLFNRVGGKPLLLLGTGLFTLTSLGFTRLDVTMSTWLISANLVLRGMSMGMVFVSMQTITYYGVPIPSMGRASSLFNVTRQVGGSFGVAILATVLARRTLSHMPAIPTQLSAQHALVQGFDDAFWAATALAAVGFLVALAMRVRKPGAVPASESSEAEAAMMPAH